MKDLKKLGTVLTKNDQKNIFGGKLDGNPPPPIVACYTINYGCIDGGFHYCSGSDPRAFPVSYTAIIPAPSGCGAIAP